MTASSKFELLHKFITELTGDAGPFAHTDYLSFFENNHAEQMIFHQRKGEPVARLLHGDALLGPWKPIEITPEGLRRGKALTTIGGVILGDGEAQWLAACFRESESWRGGDEAQA